MLYWGMFCSLSDANFGFLVFPTLGSDLFGVFRGDVFEFLALISGPSASIWHFVFFWERTNFESSGICFFSGNNFRVFGA